MPWYWLHKTSEFSAFVKDGVASPVAGASSCQSDVDDKVGI
jgi:hypothetical protein